MKYDSNDHGVSRPDYSVEAAATGGLAGDENAIQRNFRDYVVILRERIWYIVVVFLVVFLAALFYTLNLTKLFTAAASIEILPREAVVMQVQEVRESGLRGPEDLATQVKILESGAIVQKVAESLSAEDKKALMAPYETGSGEDPLVPAEVLAMNRKVAPVRQTRILQMVYTHPDGDVAAKMANLFVEEFMKYNSRWRADESMKAVDELKIRADQQGKKVQELGNNLQAYRERQKMVSLDHRKDIATEKLKTVSAMLTQSNARLAEAELRWKQVQEFQSSGRSLADLTFIGSSAIVQTLLQRVAMQKIAVAELKPRYLAKYPAMQEATQSLEQTEAELSTALTNAAATVRTDYETALRAVEQAKGDLNSQEGEELKLGRSSVDYASLQNELTVNEQLLATIVTRMRETAMNASIESQNTRIVDRAQRPRKHSSPNLVMNLAIGAMAGLGLGLSLAVLIAFMDDRVKSPAQIESALGLPLIGIVPSITKMKPADRAQIVLSDNNPLVSEAFRTLHSNLRLKSEPETSKVILVTSTTPGEGKSFVTSNLALTFAEHGERTIIVDCDLRKPTVHKSFGISNSKGVIDFCAAGASLDSLIIKNHRPGFDILPAGGRPTIPTHILNHKSFARLIAELRDRYDRVLIDTPPLAPVSDALIILPHVDGTIFTIRFNHVRTAGAKICARKILQSRVPCFGAVLNGLDLAVSDYYYAEHYGKSFKDYLIGNESTART